MIEKIVQQSKKIDYQSYDNQIFLVTRPTTTKKCQSCNNWNSFLDVNHTKGNMGENHCFHALVLTNTIDTSRRTPT